MNKYTGKIYSSVTVSWTDLNDWYRASDVDAELAKLQQRIGNLERDAKRYHHLRDQNNPLERFDQSTKVDYGLSCYHTVEGITELKHGVQLDEAIDAAIEGASHAEKQK